MGLQCSTPDEDFYTDNDNLPGLQSNFCALAFASDFFFLFGCFFVFLRAGLSASSTLRKSVMVK